MKEAVKLKIRFRRARGRPVVLSLCSGWDQYVENLVPSLRREDQRTPTLRLTGHSTAQPLWENLVRVLERRL